MILEPTRSVAPARPVLVHHVLSGETTLEMPIVFAEGTARVTLFFDGDPARCPVQVDDLALDDEGGDASRPLPTSRVAGLLYAVLGDLYRFQMAANERGDTRAACQWCNVYEAVFAFRGAWLDAAAVDQGCVPSPDGARSRRPETGQPAPVFL